MRPLHDPRNVGVLVGAAPGGRTVTLTDVEIFRLRGGEVVKYGGAADMSDLFGGNAEG